MEQREKLIELITAADDEYVYSDDDKDGTGEIAYIADHLIANGVVVLPCRCGECKKWDDDPDTYGSSDGPKGLCRKSFEIMTFDDFCSYGERKGGDE